MDEESSSPMILPKLQSIPTPRVRVYVIRHGETNWNKLGKIQGGGYDVPLNENGRLQAQTLSTALQGIRLDAVASSSLRRAKETADILHACIANKPLRVVDAGFNEMRFGRFEGLSQKDTKKDSCLKEDFRMHKQKVWDDPSYSFPSRDHEAIHPDDEEFRVQCDNSGRGESTNIVSERTLGALETLIGTVLRQERDHETRHVAIVAHGRTNKILIGGMLGMETYKTIGQGNANISVLDWTCTQMKGGFTARILNSTDHVQDMQTSAERP